MNEPEKKRYQSPEGKQAAFDRRVRLLAAYKADDGNGCCKWCSKQLEKDGEDLLHPDPVYECPGPEMPPLPVFAATPPKEKFYDKPLPPVRRPFGERED